LGGGDPYSTGGEFYSGIREEEKARFISWSVGAKLTFEGKARQQFWKKEHGGSEVDSLLGEVETTTK